eukprot:3409244-Pleurochrysis_carterae.AAC.2
MDGFPVTGFSLVHCCEYNCSLLPAYTSQSEAELTCLSVIRLPETTEALNRVYTKCGYAADMATLTLPIPPPTHPSPPPPSTTAARPPFLHVAYTFAADTKGVEAHRGSSPSCPWCFWGGRTSITYLGSVEPHHLRPTPICSGVCGVCMAASCRLPRSAKLLTYFLLAFFAPFAVRYPLRRSSS